MCSIEVDVPFFLNNFVYYFGSNIFSFKNSNQSKFALTYNQVITLDNGS
jgi:hypothetical protein